MSIGRFIQRKRLWLALILVVVALGSYGCATDEPENVSSKPWDSPEGWQNGMLPSTMFQH